MELVEEVKEYIDVVELGTPVINREGLQAVKEVKEAFPDLQVLADEKLIDATDFEVGQAIEAAGYKPGEDMFLGFDCAS
ncbi:UNVERIFIED_CONTAM: orotidine 5'-phosphate decarboxylase, partial [Aerococcus urinaeequi]